MLPGQGSAKSWRLQRRGLIAACVLLAALAGAASSPAADRQVTVTRLAVYPDENTSLTELTAFAWPDQKSLNVVVDVDLSGYGGEQRLDLFLVMLEGEKRVVRKSKGRHSLPAGSHTLLFKDFFQTNAVFSEHTYTLKVEATLKGALPSHGEMELSVTGPDEPHVSFLDTSLYIAEQGKGAQYFTPGAEFRLDALIEVEGNESSVKPRLTLYGVMEEDAYDTDPELDYQPYTAQWDTWELPSPEGEFQVLAGGRLPLFFAQPWDSEHPFRIYMIVDFGGGCRKLDYARAILYDPRPGDERRSDVLVDRLIDFDRALRWDIRRLRPALPEGLGGEEE
jgi:hypothetical protein